MHEEGVRVEADAEGKIVFRGPDGSRVEEAPVLPWLRVAGSEAIRNRLDGARIELDGKTCTPTWNGDSFDLGWAIDALRGLGGSEKRDVPGGTPARSNG